MKISCCLTDTLTRFVPEPILAPFEGLFGITGRSTLIGSGSGSPFRAVGETAKFWPNKKIRVGFFESSPPAKFTKAVRDIAPRWTEFANLEFEFVKFRDPADILITFAQPVFKSHIGIDSRIHAQRHQPSMFLGFTGQPTKDQFSFYILHEFGHALGLHHEHQNPKGGIEWDWDKVFQYFGNPPNNWSPQETRQQISELQFDKRKYTYSGPFDPKSVMMYAFPRQLTKSGFGSKLNPELSDVDKQTAVEIYPGRSGVSVETKPEVKLPINGTVIEGEIGETGEVDLYRFEIKKLALYELKISEGILLTAGVFGPNDDHRAVDEVSAIGPNTGIRIPMALDPGKYLARVRADDWRSGISGKYDISLTKRDVSLFDL